MSYWSYESKIVIDFKQSFLPKERTLKWYLKKINENFEVNLDRWFYNMHPFLSESDELEMLLYIIKAFIIFETEGGNLYCEIKRNKIYVKKFNLGGIKR